MVVDGHVLERRYIQQMALAMLGAMLSNCRSSTIAEKLRPRIGIYVFGGLSATLNKNAELLKFFDAGENYETSLILQQHKVKLQEQAWKALIWERKRDRPRDEASQLSWPAVVKIS